MSSGMPPVTCAPIRLGKSDQALMTGRHHAKASCIYVQNSISMDIPSWCLSFCSDSKAKQSKSLRQDASFQCLWR